jgi:gliding motility-associated lipoprotein GldH
MRYFYLIIPILFFLASCGDKENYIYQESKSINESGWIYADSLDFNFDIPDTSKIYGLILDVAHTTDYPFQNIYFNISTSFPSGKRLQQSLSSDLAEKSGQWHGKCSGKNCTASIFLQEKAKFNEVGKHRINIAQFSRDSVLVGIEELNLKLLAY